MSSLKNTPALPNLNSASRLLIALLLIGLFSTSGCGRFFTRLQGLPTKFTPGQETKAKQEEDEEEKKEKQLQQADSARNASSLAKAVEQIDPEEEYILGRAAAASIVAAYGVTALVDSKENAEKGNAAERYLNLVGNSVAANSDAPEVFSGYHFAILDSTEINAFAAPGAFIFVTTGLIKFLQSEEELAAVLAHEVAHVQRQHGLLAIKNEKLVDAFVKGSVTLAGAVVGSPAGGMEMLAARTAFSGLAKEMADVVIVNGYSREFERQADQDALVILQRTGYPPGALLSTLEKLAAKQQSKSTLTLLRTHDTPSARLLALTEEGKQFSRDWQPDPSREQRFSLAFTSLR